MLFASFPFIFILKTKNKELEEQKVHEDKYDELNKMYTNGNFNLTRPKEVRTLHFVLPQIYNPVTNEHCNSATTFSCPLSFIIYQN